MAVVIGGEKAWRVYRSGDIGIAFHWINDEPAMCLFPTKKRISTAGSYIICLSVVYKYVNSDGYPNLEFIIPAAGEAAETMGFSKTEKFIIHKIVEVIADGIAELIAMPPTPQDAVEQAVKENVGEMILKSDGKVIAEKEITNVDAAELQGVH